MVKWSDITTWYVVVNLVVMFIFTIVCIIGGGYDLVYFFRELNKRKIDELDDGRVPESGYEKTTNKVIPQTIEHHQLIKKESNWK